MEGGERNFFFTVRHRREEMLLSLSLSKEETTCLHSFFFDWFETEVQKGSMIIVQHCSQQFFFPKYIFLSRRQICGLKECALFLFEG